MNNQNYINPYNQYSNQIFMPTSQQPVNSTNSCVTNIYSLTVNTSKPVKKLKLKVKVKKKKVKKFRKKKVPYNYDSDYVPPGKTPEDKNFSPVEKKSNPRKRKRNKYIVESDVTSFFEGSGLSLSSCISKATKKNVSIFGKKLPTNKTWINLHPKEPCVEGNMRGYSWEINDWGNKFSITMLHMDRSALDNRDLYNSDHIVKEENAPLYFIFRFTRPGLDCLPDEVITINKQYDHRNFRSVMVALQLYFDHIMKGSAISFSEQFLRCSMGLRIRIWPTTYRVIF